MILLAPTLTLTLTLSSTLTLTLTLTLTPNPDLDIAEELAVVADLVRSGHLGKAGEI